MTGQPEPTQETALVDGETVTFAPADSDTVTWEECVLWSYRPKSEQCLDNPEYADFAKRWEASRLREVFEASIHSAAREDAAQ